MIKKPFQMYHGARRWEGAPELRSSKMGRAEWGSGLYGSNRHVTAHKYAKGGGHVRLLTMAPSLVLEKTAIPLSLAKEVANRLVPKAHRESFLEDLESNCSRMKDRMDPYHKIKGFRKEKDWMPANVLRNLMVNMDLCSGKRGLELSQFYADHGIGYGLDSAGFGNTDVWIVIFDTKKILKDERVTPDLVEKLGYDLPSPLSLIKPKAIRKESAPEM